MVHGQTRRRAQNIDASCSHVGCASSWRAGDSHQIDADRVALDLEALPVLITSEVAMSPDAAQLHESVPGAS